jgi:site-specific recombinase XerD
MPAGTEENCRAARLSSFVVETAPKFARNTRRDLCGVIRTFLRFLYRERIVAEDLSVAFEVPKLFRLSNVPRSIIWGEVRRVLEAVDRRTLRGRRDYAILLMLVTYGLRPLRAVLCVGLYSDSIPLPFRRGHSRSISTLRYKYS